MNETTTTVERYVASWNETDPAARRALIDATWSADGEYRDPLMSGDGPEGIDTMIATAQQLFPAHRLRLSGRVDAYGDRARFGWEVVAPDAGEVVVAGVDFVVLDEDGRIRSITGFLDKVPAFVTAGG